MSKRILSGIIGGALYIGLGFLGDPWLSLALGFILVLATYEFWRLSRQNALRLQVHVPAAIGLFLLAGVAIASRRAGSYAQIRAAESLFALALTLLFLASALTEILRGQVRGAVMAVSISVLTGVYLAFPMAYMILLRNLPGQAGLFYFFLLTVSIWANDTAAFFAGTVLGRRRLAPLISPKKTVEGSIAGLSASILTAAIYARCWGRSPWTFMGIGLVIGLLGQAGDLFESLIKRDFGVKDSGAFLPGHGGVLDRFDSLILTAPALYYLAAYIVH